MLSVDPLQGGARIALESAAAADALRRSREADAPADVIDIATAAAAPESASNDSGAGFGGSGNPYEASFSVDLIPGSHRLVTTVLDPDNGAVLFRIPAWLSNAEDIFGDPNAMNYL